MSTHSQKLAKGAFWLYAGQVATIVIQFGYAAVTSRAVGADQFGSYAVALSANGIISLLAQGGISQAISRTSDINSSKARSLATVTMVLGVIGAGTLALLAHGWSNLWQNHDAEFVIYFLVLNVLVAPTLALTVGLMRRQGRFKTLATVGFIANVVGMSVGAVAVFILRDSAALTFSFIITQVTLFGSTLYLTRSIGWGLGDPRQALAEVGFSLKLIFVKAFEYLNANLLKWGVSNVVGSAGLGIWNRTDVLTTVPFLQVQTAMMQVVEPEFRHAATDRNKAKVAWTEALSAVTWLFLPLGAVAGAVLPVMTPLILGPQWHLGADVFIPLALIGAITVPLSLLNSAVQSLGDLKRIWLSHSLVLLGQITGLLLLVRFSNLDFALDWMLLSGFMLHLIQILQCARAGYINLRKIILDYSLAILFSAIVSVTLNGLANSLSWVGIPSFAYLAPLVLLSGTIIRLRRRLPFVVFAKKHSLFASPLKSSDEIE